MNYLRIPFLTLLIIIVLFSLASSQDYEYLPGDANMAAGNWPPRAWGNDVTYLTGYFRGLSDPCFINGFYASADISGNCAVTGLDLTRLITYFRNIPGYDISYCDTIPPAWPTEEDLPVEAPAGWPNCGSLMLNDNSIDPIIADPQDPDIEIWVGNPDGSPIEAAIGGIFNVDVYIQTSAGVRGADFHISLGVNNLYIDSLMGWDEGQIYDDLLTWDLAEFCPPAYSPPNPEGWSSQSFVGFKEFFPPFDASYLNAESQTLMLTFVMRAVNDSSYVDQTVDCLAIGAHPSGWPLFCGDSTGTSDAGYSITVNISQVHFNDFGAIAGTVTDADDNPVENVLVEVSPGGYSDLSNSSGHYSIPGLSGGIYDVLFSHPDYCDSTVIGVSFTEGENTYLDLSFSPYGWVAGVVTDFEQNPIEGVNVGTIDGVNTAITDSNGEYLLAVYCPGENDIAFSRNGFLSYVEEGFNVPAGDTANLDVSLFSIGDSDVNLWYGGSFNDYTWSDTVYGSPAESFDVDVWFYGKSDVYVAYIVTVLGISMEYFNGFDEDGCEYYYPLTEWDEVTFLNPYEFEGAYNYSFLGFADVVLPYDSPWLHYEIPGLILSYSIEAKDDTTLIGQIYCDALVAGIDPVMGVHAAADSSGLPCSLTGWYACVSFGDYPGRGTVTGVVTDPQDNPIEGVTVELHNGLISELIAQDITGADGIYSLSNIPIGSYDLFFDHESYVDTSVSDYSIAEGVNTLNMTMWESAVEDVVFWYGNLDNNPVELEIGDLGAIDIFIQTADGVYGGNIHVPLGVDDQYFSALSSESNGEFYYPLTEWDDISFDVPYGSPPNPAGWSSQSLIGWANVSEPYDSPWLLSHIPSRIARFAAEVEDDTSYIGDTVACIGIGEHPTVGPLGVGDTLTGIYFSQIAYISEVTFMASSIKYDYLPGDANMYNGIWPPSVIGGDVTFLVGYFRSSPGSLPCLLDGFFASADANGDCQVIGGDVTKLVSYFRGITDMDYCPDYEPEWLSSDDLPDSPPPGWPNCGPALSTVKGWAVPENTTNSEEE